MITTNLYSNYTNDTNHNHYSNFNDSRLKSLRQKKSFCEQAYSNYAVQESEVELALQTPRLAFSPTQEQTQSIFLQFFPNEVQVGIFRFLDKKDLKTCRSVCKQFNSSATPLFIDKSLSTISIDFLLLKGRINSKLDLIKTLPLDSGNRKEVCFVSLLIKLYNKQKNIRGLMATAKTVSSFTAYCAFLANNTNKDIKEIKCILNFILRIQKACQANLEKNIENPQIKINSFFSKFPLLIKD